MWSGHEEGGSKDRVIKRKRRWSDTLQNRSIDGDNFFISKQRLLFWSLWWREVMKRRQKETKEDRGRECSPSATLFKIKIKTTATFLSQGFYFEACDRALAPSLCGLVSLGRSSFISVGFYFAICFWSLTPPSPSSPPWEGGGGIRRSGLLPRLISIFN